MTVKCLTDDEKSVIAQRFSNKTHSIDEMAVIYQRSRRTIIRVLEDAGIDPGIRRRQAKPAPKIDYRGECWPESPHAKDPIITRLIPTPKPTWYRRVWRAIVATATGTCV